MVKIESFKTGAMKRLVGPGEFKTIMYVNYHRYAPGETHEIHSHDDREEVFICIAGRGRLVGDFQRDIRKGDVIVVSPQEAHGFISDAEDPLEYLCVGCLCPARGPD